jgi:hypothetical protein
MPGQVGDLTLKPGSYNVSLNWKKTRSNRYCVMHYVIYWLHTLNGNNDSSTVSSEDNSFVTEDLDVCVEYEESVRAVNEKDNSTNAVTCKMTI